MLEGMAEYYSAELSVKVKHGQKENAVKCKANGGMIPFGYIINSEHYCEIDPLTAPLVLEMFTRYADGQAVVEISEAMNSRGVFINMKYKNTNKSSLHNLLKNRRYIGEYRYGDTIVSDGMPSCVYAKFLYKKFFKRLVGSSSSRFYSTSHIDLDTKYIQ